tara:strand:- start:3582 stop:4193 length:612 start_codon:yes stop_codon:yes gene_type:complete
MRASKVEYRSDEEILDLVDSSIQGNESSITTLFRIYKPILYSIAIKHRQKLSSEDIEDEIILFTAKIFTSKLHLFDKTKSKFGTWMSKSFTNHLTSIYKRKKRIQTKSIDNFYSDVDRQFNIPDTNSEFESFGEGVPFIAIARIMIKSIGPKLSRVIIYRHYYGMKAGECESKVGIPRGSYKYYERKAIDKLKRKLSPEDFIN